MSQFLITFSLNQKLKLLIKFAIRSCLRLYFKLESVVHVGTRAPRCPIFFPF